MKAFVQLGIDEYVPLSTIARIGSEYHPEGKAIMRRLYLRGDELPREVLKHEADDLLKTPLQLIPAEPGTRIIRVGPEVPHIWYTRLIGWALCLNGEVRPVTPNGVNDSVSIDTEMFVEMSDGSVEGVGEWTDPCRFESAQAMLKHFHPEVEFSDVR